MPELILIRHGETDANKALRFQGHADIPLNSMGQLQSDRLAQALRDNGILDRVVAAYSSDLQRAAQTADTALRHSDGAAREWLQIAQCFAGEPASAPPPGVRRVDYLDPVA